jgi:biopolymer transport protein ExbD
MNEEEPDDSPLINLTPLIDVVFVVLITFMIIAPMLNVDTVQLASSAQGHLKQASSLPLAITVRADNSIWVEGHPIALSDLKIWLQKEQAQLPTAVPKLIHDRRAQFGTYQAIKNLLEECGFEEMDVVLQ